jgi:hypothetical protein
MRRRLPDLHRRRDPADKKRMAMPRANRFEGTTATGAGPAFIERRRGYRQAVRATGMLRPVSRAGGDDGHGIPIHVFELSMSGIGFSTSVALAVGTVYRFDMCDKRQTPRRAEVRSCRRRADGMYDVGAQFC